MAEEISQRLRALTALAEDLGLVPSTNDICLTTVCIYLQVIPSSLLSSPVTPMLAHTKSLIYMHIHNTKDKTKIMTIMNA